MDNKQRGEYVAELKAAEDEFRPTPQDKLDYLRNYGVGGIARLMRKEGLLEDQRMIAFAYVDLAAQHDTLKNKHEALLAALKTQEIEVLIQEVGRG